VLPIYPMYSVL